MLKQQLTTLASVIGIVALGACSFGTPAPSRPTRATIAPTIDLSHMSGIRVAATNSSSSQHLKPDAVANAFVAAWRAQHPGVEIHAYGQTNPREATLDITVVSEHAAKLATPSAPADKSLPAGVSLTATLINTNGDILWHENAYQYRASCPAPSSQVPAPQPSPPLDAQPDPQLDAQPDPWTDPGFQACVAHSVAAQLADRLLHALKEPR